MQEYTVNVYKDRTEWIQNGNLHREDGPAVEYANGNKYWYQNGKLHREDGPAIERANGDKRWFNHDVEYFPTQVKEMTVADLEKELGYSIKVVKG